MKRVLALLIVMLFILSGCGDGSSSAPSSSVLPDDPPAHSAVPSGSQEQDDPVPPEVRPGWQNVYRGVLEELFSEYGHYVTDGRNDMVSGVKYVQILDFNADGVREMVVLVDRRVQLYTCRENEAVLLYECGIGGRYGQTDVSYTFCINAQAETPVLCLYHTESGWCEEAITLITLTEDGQVSQTELWAATDGENPVPDREYLVEFTIDGVAVERTVYESLRSAALDEGLEIDVDWSMYYPSTRAQLDATVDYLEHWDAADFVLPDSDLRCLTDSELIALTARELRLARNEIYARHGRAFTTTDLEAWFSGKPWYTGLYSAEEFDPVAAQTLNRYELANLSLILAVERSGSYNQDAPDLSEEEVMAIAESWWGLRTGQIDDAGRLVAISVDDPAEVGGRRYYVCRLHCLEGGDRWITRELIYIDAQSGEMETFVEE